MCIRDRIGGLFAKGALYVGLVCAAVGAPFGAAAARILKGNAPENDIAACGAALAFFCLQVPFLSLNGVCEACAHARADARALALLSGVHVACAVLFALCARPALATTGPPGLVAAGGAVMALRALVALYLARTRAFSEHGGAFVSAAAPDAVALAVFMGAGAAARRSASVASLATHVAATAVLGCCASRRFSFGTARSCLLCWGRVVPRRIEVVLFCRNVVFCVLLVLLRC